ncbi:Threonine/homoserine efflux transporter RhtA [Rhodovulum sp. ES.010]|uniref:DMT family transporter n=1 Tax=Rhodovulum sp. ES.010 TaxID=1882821 RepID=UPI00092A640D|nr:DMT family transporter [Rhodovulum sp. ES.010]SIO31751.1 Threonine/homoserine efflux transporter RhtA [Rhodovulum sp. ES.010]
MADSADASRGPPPIVGILWMLLTGANFVAVTALVKHVGDAVPAPEAAFLRYLLGLVFLAPMLRPLFRAGLNRAAFVLYGWRGLAHALGVICWFYAMTRIPIAEVTAMNYLNPVYVTIGAALVFGERLALRRILAIAVAFAGVLVILRPGFREVSDGHLAMLFTALFFGASYLMAKKLSERDNAAVVVAMLSISVTIALAPFAFAVWVTPTLTQLSWLFGVAFFATAGHFTMTMAFRAAPLTVTQPVTFLQLVWATLVGWLMFDEAVDGWVILGGGMIVGAVVFITWREAVLRRRASAPAATKP